MINKEPTSYQYLQKAAENRKEGATDA